MDNVIKAVVNFPCECICHVGEQSICDCHCQGTKRQWPILSDKCKYCVGKGTRQTKGQFSGARIPCWDCTDGYVTDVTLEKIIEIITKEGVHHYDIDYDNDRVYITLVPEGKSADEDDLPYGIGDTLLEAFCKALLDFKEWEQEQNKAVQQAHVEGCSDYGENYCNYCCIDMAEKDRIIALKQIRIEELEGQLKPKFDDKIPKFDGKGSFEEMLEKIRKQHPPLFEYKVLSRFMGDAKVQCTCGNVFEYMRDEVMCRKCRTIFPMGLFPHV